MLLSSNHATPATPRHRRLPQRLAAGICLAAAALTWQLAVSPAASATPATAAAVSPASPTTPATPAASTAAAGPAPESTTALTTQDVSFRGGGGLMLHGTVVAPAAPGPDRPGLVLVHGSGPHPRADHLLEAEAFARGGIATLIYDKRTEGYSRIQGSYSLLADDALAAVEALRAQDGVDPDNVGLWGFSEGGWVAPIAAARSADGSAEVAFLVTVAANGVSPARQQAWADDLHLRDTGVSGSLLSTMRKGTRLAMDTGMHPEGKHDPVPVLERIGQPVLALWGTLDKDTPPRRSAEIFERVLERSGNAHVTIRSFPGADHALHGTTDGYDRFDELTPGYAELVTGWVGAVAAGNPPASSAQFSPAEDREVPALAPLAWWEPPWATMGAVVPLLIAFGSYPVTAAARRLTGRRGTSAARWPARWLSAAGPLTVLGFLGYVFFVKLVTAGEAVGPIVLGRPVIWVALQLLAVSVVVTTALVAARWWRARGDLTAGTRARLGLLFTGGIVFAPWALYWGLLTP